MCMVCLIYVCISVWSEINFQMNRLILMRNLSTDYVQFQIKSSIYTEENDARKPAESEKKNYKFHTRGLNSADPSWTGVVDYCLITLRK